VVRELGDNNPARTSCGKYGKGEQCQRSDAHLAEAVGRPVDYAADVSNSIGSMIEGSSFPGLLTRVEIGHIRIGSAGNGRPRRIIVDAAGLERGNTLGLISHEGFLAIRFPPSALLRTNLSPLRAQTNAGRPLVILGPWPTCSRAF
jgi:hypothetical protein